MKTKYIKQFKIQSSIKDRLRTVIEKLLTKIFWLSPLCYADVTEIGKYSTPAMCCPIWREDNFD